MSTTGLYLVIAALIAAVIGVQTLRLANAKHDLGVARASLVTAQASLKVSEDLRKAEYAKAISALSDAETACQARLAKALQSATVIRTIVTRPARVDPKTNCPARDLVSADELRRAVGVGTPATP